MGSYTYLPSPMRIPIWKDSRSMMSDISAVVHQKRNRKCFFNIFSAPTLLGIPYLS